MGNLWLFDIDGILVHLTGNPEKDPHLKAYRRDYKEVLGIEVPAGLIRSTYGMTETEMHRHICSQTNIEMQLKKRNMEYSDDIGSRLTNAHLLHFMEELEALDSIEPLDGVIEFLTYLQKHQEYRGVVTGNLKKPAELILKRSGLMNLFSILSCDDGNSSRTKILECAIYEAKNQKYDFSRVVVIDDTPKGIEAGKNLSEYVNTFTAGVATGSATFEELERAKPDIVVPTLKNYQLILDALKSEIPS